jgi:IS5 family transposase
MRQRFEQQMQIGGIAIKDVHINLKSRDELPPVMKALQYIFVTPDLNEKIFSLLEAKICAGKKKTGRPGMDLWHILVLAVVRHATSTNWDTLEGWSNYHMLVRKIMGVHSKFDDADDDQGITFGYQSIIDNVSLIDEELLYEINQIVVDAGHRLVKKKDEESLELKTDSYAVETNVHFPTDLNLLWDSIRKCLDVVNHIQKQGCRLPGWRKIKYLRSNSKSLFRSASQHVFKGRSEPQKVKSVKLYLAAASELKERFEDIITNPPVAANLAAVVALKHYCDYVNKFADQVERRLIKGEQIPAQEKVFSIFEPHTEWITKGKQNKKVELGHLLLITTDQHQFIVDYKVMEKQKDPSQVIPLLNRIQKNFPSIEISSHSFDKGFYSKDNWEALEQSGTKLPVLPKRGRHNKADKERESDDGFKKIKRRHSAVESNINMLEHHGLNRCMDKGLRNFKRYVGLSVLAYNLHIMGNALIAAERKKQEQEMKMAA